MTVTASEPVELPTHHRIPAIDPDMFERFGYVATMGLYARLLDKTNFRGPTPDHLPDLGPCWVWHGGFRNKHFRYGGVWFAGKSRLVHRASWMLWRGAIPAGLTVDHRCRNTLCINPYHQRLATIGENVRADHGRGDLPGSRTHCPSGHEYTEENTYRGPAPRNFRRCRTCRHEEALARVEARRAEAATALEMATQAA